MQTNATDVMSVIKRAKSVNPTIGIEIEQHLLEMTDLTNFCQTKAFSHDLIFDNIESRSLEKVTADCVNRLFVYLIIYLFI